MLMIIRHGVQLMTIVKESSHNECHLVSDRI